MDKTCFSIKVYFSSQLFVFWLKNVIGYSSFFPCFCVKIATILVLEPYAYNINSLLKYGFLRTSALVIIDLIF